MTDNTPIIAVMDGDCALCSFGARMIARHDRSGRVRIAPVHTTTGQRLLIAAGLDPNDPDSWLVQDGDQTHTNLDAILHLTRTFGGIWKVTQIGWLIPKPLRDWIYRRIARNRYAMFGHAQMCAIPDPTLKARLIED